MRVKDNGERDGIGDAIARKFPREGAQVVLASAAIEPRRRAPVDDGAQRGLPRATAVFPPEFGSRSDRRLTNRR